MLLEFPHLQNEVMGVFRSSLLSAPMVLNFPSTTTGPSFMILMLVGFSLTASVPEMVSGVSSSIVTGRCAAFSSSVRSLLYFQKMAWVGHLLTTSMIRLVGAPCMFTQGLRPGLNTSINSLKQVVACMHFEGIQKTVISPLVYCLFLGSVIHSN